MGFNFTDEDLQGASEVQVFNGGKAGKVEGVTVTMEEAGVDGVPVNANENAPKFKVWFTDAKGARVNKACFDIKAENYPNQYGKTYEETIKKEWAYLNKIVEHTGGTKVMSFENDVDLFRKIKQAIGPNKVNIFVNYGTVSNKKAYLEPRKWMPAVEAAGTPESESKLRASNLDAMQPLVADEPKEAEQNWI